MPSRATREQQRRTREERSRLRSSPSPSPPHAANLPRQSPRTKSIRMYVLLPLLFLLFPLLLFFSSSSGCPHPWREGVSIRRLDHHLTWRPWTISPPLPSRPLPSAPIPSPPAPLPSPLSPLSPLPLSSPSLLILFSDLF